MTSLRHADERELDLAFERQLLSSAGADGPSQTELRIAWPRFVSATGAAALVAGVDVRPGAFARSLARTRVTSFVAGALGGVLVTLGWFTASPDSRLRAPSPSASSGRTTTELLAPAPARVPAPVAPLPLRSAAQEQPPARELEPARVATPRLSNLKTRSIETAPGSTLAAEIEALDAARAALAAGRNAEALELTDAHRRQFPSGQLSSDVEALAIDALARAGRRSEATARAARFLSRFPKSPHAARIESIAAP